MHQGTRTLNRNRDVRSIERERPIRDRKPIVRLGVQERWHDEIGPDTGDPPEGGSVNDPDLTWAPPRHTPAARRGTGDPARPPSQVEATRGGEHSPRHNLLGNQDSWTGPRDQRDEMQPCTYCRGTDHGADECDRDSLACEKCYVSGRSSAACDVFCKICKTNGLHIEKDCPDFCADGEPLINSSPH